MAEYSKAFMIQYLRKQRGMTQEELAEGICDIVTLSRYETGVLNPTGEKFQRLMKKLGRPGDTYAFPVQTEQLYFEKKMKDILYAFERNEFKKAQFLLEEIKKEKSLLLEYKENRQYMGRIQCIVDYRLERIGEEEYIREMEELLQMTFPDFQSKEPIPAHIYTETEFLIAYNIGIAYGKKGEFPISRNILGELVKHCKRIDTGEDYKPAYIMFVGYSNLLGLNGAYDESIEICLEGIRWLKEKKKSNYLYNLYYNIGWNLIEKYKKNRQEKSLLEAGKRYMWISYQLCNLYPEYKGNLKPIQSYYEKIEK